PVPARREDARRRVLELPQALGDLEAVEVRQLDVEQDEVRVKLPGNGHRRLPVRGLADDLVTLRLEQRPGARPKAGMVVDDQHCHMHSFASLGRSPYTAIHTLV